MKNRNKIKKLQKFTSKMQAKLLLVFCILIIGILALIGRLVYLNRSDGDRYKKRVLSQQTYSTSVIPFQRGDIRDRKGTVLATSQKVYNVILDVKKLLAQEDEEYISSTKSAIVTSFPSITEEHLQQVLENKKTSQYVILHKKISYEEVANFKALQDAKDAKITGVWFEEDYKRLYPYNTLGSSILGFTIGGTQGNWGLEQAYNDELNGTDGREYGYIDETLKLERTVKRAVNGNTIISTIDANVQGIVQSHIKKFNEDIGSKNIGVILMNPNNGEILAMASNQEYDLNNPMDLTPFYTKAELDAMTQKEKEDAMYTLWRNYAISDSYEPGSTFKPFTIAGALDEGFTHVNEEFYCDGHEIVGGWIIRCSNRSGHKNLNLTEALMKSCNDVLMELVNRTGKNLFARYQTFFGFGTKTGIDLPGEASGLLIDEDVMSVSDLATSSFGQTFTTTMIQMATSYSSLVNGGSYYEPHMVKQILNDKGGTVKTIDKVLVKETVTKSTSQFINDAMYQTVEEGTAGGAKVPGYKVGGKTGTAEKQPRSAKKYVVSFIGSVPADDPEVVIYVVIDEPENVVKQADSSIATKFASRILTDVLPFLEIYPTESIDSDGITNTQTPSENTTNSNNVNSETEQVQPADSNNTESSNEQTEEEQSTANESNETEGNASSGDTNIEGLPATSQTKEPLGDDSDSIMEPVNPEDDTVDGEQNTDTLTDEQTTDEETTDEETTEP